LLILLYLLLLIAGRVLCLILMPVLPIINVFWFTSMLVPSNFTTLSLSRSEINFTCLMNLQNQTVDLLLNTRLHTLKTLRDSEKTVAAVNVFAERLNTSDPSEYDHFSSTFIALVGGAQGAELAVQKYGDLAAMLVNK
jgi:hypothetical protein